MLLHTGLTPSPRKQQQAVAWLSKAEESGIAYARQCAQSLQFGLNRDLEALDVLLHLKDLVGSKSFLEHDEWTEFAITVATRILESQKQGTSPNTVDRPEEAQPKMLPLQLLYDVYLHRFTVNPAASPAKDAFVHARTELARCYFALSEAGLLEMILRKHREFNTAPLWRILVNQQVAFGWKKEAAISCVQMAQFAENSGMTALATISREEALSLDPNVKMEGFEFESMTFMTKEELRQATRDEIISSFRSDPLNQHNYEHLIDFLEEEGAIIDAVRVIVSHTLTSRVPQQYHAATALPLRRLITLVSHLQSKYIPQLQILSSEANHHRASQGMEPLDPPELQSLLRQLEREEEYRPFTTQVLETIATKISPPSIEDTATTTDAFTSATTNSTQLLQASSPSSPSSNNPSIAAAQSKSAQRSSWGVKPNQGKDRNKRFTLGIRTPGSGGGFGSRSAEIISHSSPSNGTAAAMGDGSANKTPGPGRPPANFAWSPNNVRLAPPSGVDIFSQPLSPPVGRLHTPSVLTPFSAPNVPLTHTTDAPQPLLQQSSMTAEDSPFSSTMFGSMPDQLSSHSELPQYHASPPTDYEHHTSTEEEESPPPPPTDETNASLWASDHHMSHNSSIGGYSSFSTTSATRLTDSAASWAGSSTASLTSSASSLTGTYPPGTTTTSTPGSASASMSQITTTTTAAPSTTSTTTATNNGVAQFSLSSLPLATNLPTPASFLASSTGSSSSPSLTPSPSASSLSSSLSSLMPSNPALITPSNLPLTPSSSSFSSSNPPLVIGSGSSLGVSPSSSSPALTSINPTLPYSMLASPGLPSEFRSSSPASSLLPTPTNMSFGFVPPTTTTIAPGGSAALRSQSPLTGPSLSYFTPSTSGTSASSYLTYSNTPLGNPALGNSALHMNPTSTSSGMAPTPSPTVPYSTSLTSSGLLGPPTMLAAPTSNSPTMYSAPQ